MTTTTTDGTCPVCNGSFRKPAEEGRRYVCCGWDKETDTIPCDNCGGQYMFSRGPTGLVPLRPDGTPCNHEYSHQLISNCYHGYTCKHCGDKHNIDTGD
jgi:hypothetical protein